MATGGDISISSVTDTFTGTGSWTIVQDSNTSEQQNTGFIAYATLGGTPGSGTVTVNVVNNAMRTVIDVYEVTDHDGVSQSATNTGTATTLTVTFSGSPASDSLVFAAVGSRTDADPDVTPGTDFTELGEVFSAGTFRQAHVQCQYDAAGADTTSDWSTLPTRANIGIAIEIAAAAVASARRVFITHT